MKWGPVHPEPDRWDFTPADTLVAFAAKHQMKVKGHALLWHQALPGWVNAGMTPEALRDAMRQHILRLVGRYKGRVFAWDVLNEAVDEQGRLRKTLFLDTLGEGYVSEAFRLAHEADPDALLIYNDYGIEAPGPKLDGVCRLLERLRAEGVPVHGVGIQMHIEAAACPDPAALATLVRRLAGLGLKVNISEMDVRVRDVPGSRADKLEAQRRVYHDVISACCGEKGFMAVTFWGFTDAHSWVDGSFGEDDPLLFDEQYRPKPACDGVRDALLARRVPATGRPAGWAVRVSDAPVLDGRLDDAAWREATPLILRVRQDGAPRRFATEIRFVHDREALYAGVRAAEPDPAGLVLHPDDPASVAGDDCVEIFVDPGQTGRRYFQHIVNAAGTRLSFLYTDAGASTGLTAAHGREEAAWTLEVKMPFRDFGMTPAAGDRWGLDVARNRVGRGPNDEGEYSYWSPGRVPYGAPAKFGTLIFGLGPGGPAPADPPDDAVTTRLFRRIQQEQDRAAPWTDEDLNGSLRRERARRLLAMAGLLSGFPDTRLWCAVRPAITDEPVLPWSVPDPREIGDEVRITACRGEFESASLHLFAARDVSDVRIEASDLRTDDNRILPAGVVDPFFVQCWYQTGVCDNYHRQITLVPELLVRSPALMSVDSGRRRNILNFEKVPDDADALQPFAIPAFESRQVWLRVHVPAGAEPGLYKGTLRVSDAGGLCATAPVRLRVPDWNLQPSPLLHGLYYGRQATAGLKTVAQEDAFFARMEKEIRDQIEHGCNIVGSYVHPGPLPSDPSPFATLARIDAIQSRHGITGTPYFCVVACAGFQSGDALKALREEAGRLAGWAREHGRSAFVYQGRDEAPPDEQKRQLPAWQAVHDGGARVFVAGGDIDVAGKLLDFPVVGGALRPDLARRAHALGVKVLSYAHPFTGAEMPERYRRNYGLRLWAAGYDGALNFCYGDTEENPNAWNEFADNNWRHTSFVYPAVDGPIDTIEFEGWREAVDDVRYAATLGKAVDDAIKSGRHRALAEESGTWLRSLTGEESDLDGVRAGMIRRIDELLDNRRSE